MRRLVALAEPGCCSAPRRRRRRTRSCARSSRRSARRSCSHTIETLVELRHAAHPVVADRSQARDRRGARLDASESSDSAACGNCLTVATVRDVHRRRACRRRRGCRDMVAIQRGTERPNDVVIIQGHIDSRVTDVMNVTSDAPGANDDGSGTAAVIEAARVLSKHKFPGTIVYAALSGEEQGLYGGKVLAELRQGAGLERRRRPQQRHHRQQLLVRTACAMPRMCASCRKGRARRGRPSSPAQTHSLGGENDAPSRNISRYPRQPRRPAEDRPRRPADLAHRPLRPRRRPYPVPRARLSRRRGSASRSRITIGSTRICGPRTACAMATPSTISISPISPR